MLVWTDRKTKSIVLARELARYKIETDERIVEQVVDFKYLNGNIFSDRCTHNEIREQVTKRASGYDLEKQILLYKPWKKE